MTDPAMRIAILDTLAGTKSLAPVEIARKLSPEAWQPLLPRIRREAVALAREGAIEILRKGRPLDPEGEIRGVVRLRLKAE